jgi:hypothetical protein
VKGEGFQVFRLIVYGSVFGFYDLEMEVLGSGFIYIY